MIGDEAAPLRAMLELSHPTEEGIVRNWDDMQLLLEYSFAKVKARPSEQPILMTEAVMNPL
jgi:actin-related protein